MNSHIHTNGGSHRSSMSSIEWSNSNSSLPTVRLENGKTLKGYDNEDALRNWLKSIKSEQYIKNFVDNGYDLHLISRMTPQDLSAIGCRSPEVRKKLLLEIKKLKLRDNIPDFRPNSLKLWLEKLKLEIYYERLLDEGFNTIDRVCELSWEDFEDIGLYKLGHQKRLLLGIEAIKKFDEIQEQRLNEPQLMHEIHPNNRKSVHENRMGTLGRATLRSGFSQSRSVIKNEVTSNDQIYGTGANHYQLSTMKRCNPPTPPVRTNSLKLPQMSENGFVNNNNCIYGVSCGVLPAPVITNQSPMFVSNDSTSFLRTPKLGTLTATTNKMLQNGGHIDSISSHTIMSTSVPCREAPPRPMPLVNPPLIHHKIIEEPILPSHSISNSSSNTIEDEEDFPPPPPMSTLEN